MENIKKYKEIWFLLSYLFVDNEVDYKFITKYIYDCSLTDIHYKLFYEVAPICAPNLSSPTPHVWTFFDTNTIVPLIEEHIIKYREYNIYRIKIKILASYYKIKYKNIGYI